MTQVELRVHGVSGTDPRDILYTDPVVTGGDRFIPEWGWAEPKGGSIPAQRAYRWAGLTSGPWWTAFWVLLFPFALCNVSGWTAQPGLGPRRRWSFVFFSRLAALGITGIYMMSVMLVLFDLPWHALFADPAPATKGVVENVVTWARGAPKWIVVALGVLCVGVLAVTGWFASRSHFKRSDPGEQRPQVTDLQSDPALEEMLLSNAEMWTRHPLAEHQLWGHLSFGLAVIGVVMITGSRADLADALTNSWWAFAALALTAVAVAIVGVWTLRLAKVLSLVLSIYGLFLLLKAIPGESHLSGFHDLSFYFVVFVVAAAGIAALLGKSLISGGLITLGAVAGSALGVGVAKFAAGWLGVPDGIPTGVAWAAIGNLFVLLVIALWAVLSIMIRALGSDKSKFTTKPARLMAGIRATVAASRRMLAGVFFGVVVSTGYAIFQRCSNGGCVTGNLGDSTDLLWVPRVAAGLAALLVLGAVVLIGWLKGPGWGLLAALAMILSGWFLVRGLGETTLFGVPLAIDSFLAAAFAAGILGPAALIVGRMRSSISDVNARRKVGIVWDVAGLWPRWYHPFAPPPYGPNAVQQLVNLIRDRAATGTVVVAGHSQGSVLASTALSRIEESSVLAKTGLITYGSPLYRLYVLAFPAHVTDGWRDQLALRLTSEDGSTRWRNLYRLTDPIGGAVFGGEDPLREPAPDARDVSVRFIRVEADDPLLQPMESHSRYERTGEYGTAKVAVTP